MNISTMLDITRSAPTPHLVRSRARLLPNITLVSIIFCSLAKASLVATARDHKRSIHSRADITFRCIATIDRKKNYRMNLILDRRDCLQK